MVDTPNAAFAATVSEAAFAGPLISDTIDEMYANFSPTLRLMTGKEGWLMELFRKKTGKKPTMKNGYKPTIIKASTQSSIERYVQGSAMTSVTNNSVASAGATDIDDSPPTLNQRVLTGDYGVTHGNVNRELFHKVRGNPGGQMRNDINERFVTDLAQAFSTQMNTNMFANGSSNATDGHALWVAATGTKWNSENIASTAQYLQGRTEALALTDWNINTLQRVMRRTHQGLVSAATPTISEGLWPDYCVCSSNLFDVLADEMHDKIVLNTGPSPNANAKMFTEFGLGVDFFMIGQCCFFSDYYLDANLGGNVGIAYMGNTAYWELIYHSDYWFTDYDPEKTGVRPSARWEELPNRLDRDVCKLIALYNLYNKRPRNLTYITAN